MIVHPISEMCTEACFPKIYVDPWLSRDDFYSPVFRYPFSLSFIYKLRRGYVYMDKPSRKIFWEKICFRKKDIFVGASICEYPFNFVFLTLKIVKKSGLNLEFSLKHKFQSAVGSFLVLLILQVWATCLKLAVYKYSLERFIFVNFYNIQAFDDIKFCLSFKKCVYRELFILKSLWDITLFMLYKNK